MAAVGLTAPTSWGWIGGSTLSLGVVNGFNSAAAPAEGASGNQTSFYAGATMNTPLSTLKLGASLDYLTIHDASDFDPDLNGDAWDGALYASFQATEKLSVNVRGEFLDDAADTFVDSSDVNGRQKIWAFTGTAQYDLWKNVITRVEFRWDHGDNGQYFGGTVSGEPDRKNAYLLAAQVIYKF
jgi:hypothetical protein